MAHEHDEAVGADIRQSRRRLLRYAVGGAGLLALSGSGVISLRDAIAKDGEDDDDDDNSGSGSGGDDNSGHGSDNSGHGNGHDNDDDGGDDDDDSVAVTGEIPEGSIQITIVDDDPYGFSPGELTVDLGQSVTFVNTHHDPHTATGSGFDTGIMQPGQTATVVLDKPGRFVYACQIHPEMTGSITVRDADGQIPESSQSSTAPVDATAIQITNFTFDPPTISITTGTTVSWTNNDTAPHTVTALDGAFDSGIVDPGSTFSWEFTNPGSYAYRCDLHPQMQASIEVTGEPVAASSPMASPVAATPEASPATPTPEPTPEPALTPVTSNSEPVTVTISNFLFDPSTLDISAGTTVTWINEDSVPHTATALDTSFDTGRLDQGQEGSITFDTAGSYDYRCSFHPSMLGSVVVT